MANDKDAVLQTLASNTEKALRRSNKLERTLRKIVTQSEAGSAAEEFLKAVRQGTKNLKKEARQAQKSLSPTKRKAVSKPATTAKPADSDQPIKRSRKRTPRAQAASETTPADA